MEKNSDKIKKSPTENKFDLKMCILYQMIKYLVDSHTPISITTFIHFYILWNSRAKFSHSNHKLTKFILPSQYNFAYFDGGVSDIFSGLAP